MSTDDFGEGPVETEVVRDSVPYMKMSVKRDERAYVYLLLATHSRMGVALRPILDNAAKTILEDVNNDNAERLHAAVVRLSGVLQDGQGSLHELFTTASYQLYPQERMLLALDFAQIEDNPQMAAILFSALSEAVPVRAI